MNLMCNSNSSNNFIKLFRHFCCTSAMNSKQWRTGKGLPENKMSEGVLTDRPDYTFIDGRPTPLLHKQKLRMLRQRDYASKIVESISELDFAKQRHQDILKAKEEERQRIIDNRLKPKGRTTLNE